MEGTIIGVDEVTNSAERKHNAHTKRLFKLSHTAIYLFYRLSLTVDAGCILGCGLWALTAMKISVLPVQNCLWKEQSHCKRFRCCFSLRSNI